jgi:hypothetical protein
MLVDVSPAEPTGRSKSQHLCQGLVVPGGFVGTFGNWVGLLANCAPQDSPTTTTKKKPTTLMIPNWWYHWDIMGIMVYNHWSNRNWIRQTAQPQVGEFESYIQVRPISHHIYITCWLYPHHIPILAPFDPKMDENIEFLEGDFPLLTLWPWVIVHATSAGEIAPIVFYFAVSFCLVIYFLATP